VPGASGFAGTGSRCNAPRAPQIPEESGCRVSAFGDDPIAQNQTGTYAAVWRLAGETNGKRPQSRLGSRRRKHIVTQGGSKL
jgi:hypothetical protein